MRLSKEQEKIAHTKEDKVLVSAAAAAGKTRTLTERVRFMLKRGINPKRMVVITFTNHASEEMRERIKPPEDLFVGTIHSYCAHLLSQGGVDISTILAEERFNDLFPLLENHLECVKEVDYLIMDESQDTKGELADFILDTINPKGYMFFFDPRQQIYGFDGSNPTRIYELRHDPEVITYSLNNNYRNSILILNFARKMLETLPPFYRDRTHAMRPDMGEVVEIDYDLYFLGAIIPTKDTYKDWFVLCRVNAQIEPVKKYLESVGIPVDSFKQAELTKEELSQKMKSNTVKVLTIHSAKGLEANNVVVIGARFWNDEEKRVSYVGATRARNYLVWMKGRPNRKRAKKTIKTKMLKW